jgi:hypothetical protein
MLENGAEIEYYRAIEDRFAALRGVPHTLSPKDFQLMRRWWNERVPLAAVTSALTEVFARRQERGESDAVVSLTYCRHAVASHARRLSDARVGQLTGATTDPTSRTEALERLAGEMREVASRRADRPAVVAAIERTAQLVEAATDMDEAALDEHLFSLEALLLEACWNGLDDDERSRIDEVANAAAASTTETGRDRARRAARDRELRRRLDLPRLEVP